MAHEEVHDRFGHHVHEIFSHNIKVGLDQGFCGEATQTESDDVFKKEKQKKSQSASVVSERPK